MDHGGRRPSRDWIKQAAKALLAGRRGQVGRRRCRQLSSVGPRKSSSDTNQQVIAGKAERTLLATEPDLCRLGQDRPVVAGGGVGAPGAPLEGVIPLWLAKTTGSAAGRSSPASASLPPVLASPVPARVPALSRSISRPEADPASPAAAAIVRSCCWYGHQALAALMLAVMEAAVMQTRIVGEIENDRAATSSAYALQCGLREVDPRHQVR